MIEVLYEDDYLLFVNKPPHVIVQRGRDPDEPVLFEQAASRTGKPIHLLQRLDRGTSGVIFFSKESAINVRLTRQFERREIEKRYLAICEGALAQRQTIDAPLARTGAITFGVREHGKRSVTHVVPLDANARGSLLDLHLETGRTHQIRVHLAAIGHPLAGDWLYGTRGAARPMLHASAVTLFHPISRKTLRVAAPLPQDFLEEANRRGISIREIGEAATSAL